MSRIKSWLQHLNRIQQARIWLAVPVAVVKKYGDDQAGYLASLVAYYGFFSLFPLLLVLATVLGFALQKDPRLAQDIIHSTLANLPVIGPQIRVHTLHGNGFGLVAGLAFTVLAGIAVIQAMQYGMDEIWGVPFLKRSNWLKSRARAALMLAVLGFFSLAATALGSVSTLGAQVPFASKALGALGSLGLGFVTVALAFRILTVAELTWPDVLPGAAVAAVGLEVLNLLGAAYIHHILKSANQTYGTFASIIGLLSWLYIGTQITFYAAEVNVVLVQHLWPRSLSEKTTPADRRALTRQATKQRRRQEQRIDVEYGPPTGN